MSPTPILPHLFKRWEDHEYCADCGRMPGDSLHIRVATLNVCPWCREVFPCKAKCIVTYTVGPNIPTKEIADGVYMLDPGAIIVVRGSGK